MIGYQHRGGLGMAQRPEHRMATLAMLSYSADQGEVTDPREHARLFDEVPHDIAGWCPVAQGLIVHVASRSTVSGQSR